MKKQITWQDNTLKIIKLYLFLLISLTLSNVSNASEKWIMDKSLSSIEFELPVLFAKNVRGKFNTFEGFVELDLDKKENNKAIFSVKIDDIEMNYIKYKDLLLSNVFFDSSNYPKVIVDTKKFSYVNEKELELKIELSIKGKNKIVPLKIYVTHLAEELVQIQTELVFSRTAFEIGINNWKNTSILKDKIKLTTNLFLFKE